MKRILAAGAAALITTCLATAAQAQEAWIGAYAHDVKGIGLAKGGLETGADIQLGYKTAPIQALHAIFSPSFYVLGSLNTSSGTNFAGVGLGWRINLGRKWYFDPGLGFVGQDGYVRTPPANAPGLFDAAIDVLVRIQAQPPRPHIVLAVTAAGRELCPQP